MKKLDNNGFGIIEMILVLLAVIILLMIFRTPITNAISGVIDQLQNLTGMWQAERS